MRDGKKSEVISESPAMATFLKEMDSSQQQQQWQGAIVTQYQKSHQEEHGAGRIALLL